MGMPMHITLLAAKCCSCELVVSTWSVYSLVTALSEKNVDKTYRAINGLPPVTSPHKPLRALM